MWYNIFLEPSTFFHVSHDCVTVVIVMCDVTISLFF